MTARFFGERQVDTPLSVVKNTRCPLVLVTVALFACDGSHSFDVSQEAGFLIVFRIRTLSPDLNSVLFASCLLRCLNDGDVSRRRSSCCSSLTCSVSD